MLFAEQNPRLLFGAGGIILSSSSTERTAYWTKCSVLLNDMEQTNDNRTQDHIYRHLKEEITSGQTKDHVVASILIAQGQCPTGNGLHEKNDTADQEQSRIDYRANDGRTNDSHISALLFHELIDQSGDQAASGTLDKNRHDSAEHVNCEERACISHQYDDTKDEAQPGTDLRTADRRTDHDRDQDQRNREHTEPDKLSHTLQHNDQRGQDSTVRKAPCRHLTLCIQNNFLLAVPPDLPDGMHIYHQR